ncbi:aminotransferase class IV [Brunnivagina elsteri]|uniref:4-amino-4-deoxychorismate lyase n=1 Tax=Brunnivagina elsteri CCALA 953 TaxID=987040 RepID=A0A2A2TDC3_9CYAN|nr:aminotransferase class IV [Calothrix elsteri]PAX51713.1 4-amino-4-deoxychorismate lyase [Calothrix elsteri CCALA 953]
MFWYNGKLNNSQTIELDINNPGLLYGATIFTTLRIYDNSLSNPLTNWEAHIERIKTSVDFFNQHLNWQQPNYNQIHQGCEVMKQHFPVLRITVFPDGKEWITGRNLPQDLAERQKSGISAIIASPNLSRSQPNYKTSNYLTSWLAKSMAENYNSQEAIFVDESGNWLETTTGNLWGWKDGCWWTPPIDGKILPGIMRSHILNSLTNQHQQVGEEPWTQELVTSLETLAYSNSVVELIPIHTVIQPTSKLKYNFHHPALKQLQRIFI